MPRVTRAALRSQVVEDSPDTNCNTDTVDQVTATTNETRPPLGEVTGNTAPTPELTTPEEMPIKKTTSNSKGKKGKGGKKNKLELMVEIKEDNSLPQVLEDENQSDVSSAAEAASEELRKEDVAEETYQVPMHDMDRPKTPPSAAARAASKQLSPTKTDTPRFDPAIDVDQEIEETSKLEGGKEDSFVDSIKTRSPTKAMSNSEEQVEEKEDPKEDSFVEQIVTRSPVKPVLRIEDSVEAIDALEDALEQVGQALPLVQDTGLESPVKTRTPGKKTKAKTPKGQKPATKPPTQKQAPSTAKAVVEKKAAPMQRKRATPEERANMLKTPYPPLPTTKRVQSRPRVSKKENTRPARPSLIDNAGPTIGPPPSKPSTTNNRTSLQLNPKRNATEHPQPNPPTTDASHPKPPRPASISLSTSRAPFIPSKSSKPPTKSTFTLPGDAISAKLKAQREERLKLAEAEEAKKREFKARPVRISKVPDVIVKETAASRARASLMAGGLDGGEGKENVNGNGKRQSVVAVRTSSIGNDKRHSTVLSVAKRAQPTSINTVPSSAATANTTRSSSRAPAPLGSTTAATARQVSQSDISLQKLRAKQIFGRDRAEKEEREETRREKEDAAKKARAEAAERGRQASREWAERQKRKIREGLLVVEKGKGENGGVVGLGVQGLEDERMEKMVVEEAEVAVVWN